MRILSGMSFTLPFIEKDKFVKLRRLGVSYDKTRRSYSIKGYNDVEEIIDVISDILDEQVSFLQTCTLCEKEFPCSDCKYCDSCGTRGLPLQCVCQNCLGNAELYNHYIERDLSSV